MQSAQQNHLFMVLLTFSLSQMMLRKSDSQIMLGSLLNYATAVTHSPVNNPSTKNSITLLLRDLSLPCYAHSMLHQKSLSALDP